MKYINSYWIEKLESGIIHLLFNTIDKWEGYHEYCIGSYKIGPDSENEEPQEEWESKLIKIPEALFQQEEGVRYICMKMQDKDQISFYYVPRHLIWDGPGKRNIIHEYKKEKQ